MSKNEFKPAETPEEPVKKKEKAKKSGDNRLMVTFRSILNGEILTRRAMLRLLPFVLYLCFLIVLYIGNSYNYEKNIKEATKIKDELIELESEYIKIQSDLMYIKHQSKLAQRLDSLNTGIKESIVPPVLKIFDKGPTDGNTKP